ncbi:MAG: hypothetical protein ACSHWU_07630 [Marinicella sp.]
MQTDSLTVTKQYFAWSNQADLSNIRTLIHPDATYSSVSTGLYFGVKDIMQMMENFYQSQQLLQWKIDQIQALTPHITEVKFSMHSIDLNHKEHHRTGTERLVVVDGLIRHIEVR